MQAHDLAAQTVAVNPYSSSAHGVLVDALVEVGSDREALTTLQRMVDLRPGVHSYTRALAQIRDSFEARRRVRRVKVV